MFSKSFQPTQHKIIRILCLTAVVLLLSFLYGTRALFYAFFTDPAVLKGRRLPPVLCATAAAQPPGPDGTGYTAGPASPLSREPLRDPFRPGVSAPVRDDVLLPEARQGAGHPENPAPPVQTYRPDRSREPELFAVFPLDYISAADLHQSLADLGIRGRLALSAVSNALLFSGTMAEKQRLRELIRRLDVPGRQVTLQATMPCPVTPVRKRTVPASPEAAPPAPTIRDISSSGPRPGRSSVSGPRCVPSSRPAKPGSWRRRALSRCPARKRASSSAATSRS